MNGTQNLIWLRCRSWFIVEEEDLEELQEEELVTDAGTDENKF